MEQAKIYRKQDLRPLSDHQKAVNDAAGAICLENPTMLVQRKNLYEQAQERVHKEGFAYKKGKSRCVYMYCTVIRCVCVVWSYSSSEKLILISPLPPSVSVCVACVSTMFTLELVCCGYIIVQSSLTLVQLTYY